jgi:hypothetical protein
MAKTKRITAAEAGELLEKVLSCEPIIGESKVLSIEEICASQEFGMTRRCATALAMKGGDFYKKVSEDRDTAVAIARVTHWAEIQAKQLRELCEIYDVVAARAAIATAKHKDAKAIWQEAEFDGLSLVWNADAP